MCGFNWLFIQIYIELMVYQNIFCNYFIFIKKRHQMSINKKLLEEINRFRMMSTYQPGKLLNEQDEDKESAFGSDEKFEKFSPANKELVEIYMSRDLTDMVLKKVTDYTKNVKITIIPQKIDEYPGVEFTIKVDNNILGTTTWDSKTMSSNYSLLDKKFSTVGRDDYGNPTVKTFYGWKVGDFVVTNLYDEFIKEYPKYNTFFESNTDKFLENNLSISEYVKNRINSQKITFLIKESFYGDQAQREDLGGNKKFGINVTFSREEFSKKEWVELSKNATTVELGDQDYNATTGSLFNLYDTDGLILVNQGSDRFGQFRVNMGESTAPIPVDLVLNIPPQFSPGNVDGGLTGSTPTPTPPPLVAPIELKLDLINAYAFDKVDKGGSSWWKELTATEKGGKTGQEQFDAFIAEYNRLKVEYVDVWDKYLEFLKNNKVTIYGYASIDRNPTDTQIGGYPGCQGYKNIKDYNQCLSEKRAQQSVKDIVAKIPELDGILVPVGGGQTDKFDGKNYTNATSSETYQNRRIYGVFPKYETTR